MIHLTDTAREKVLEFMKLEDKEGSALRIECTPRGGTFQYALNLVSEDEATGDDEVQDLGSLKLLVDPRSAPYLDQVKIDFVQQGLESGFKFDNPNPRWKDPTASAVQEVIDREINPVIASHGGFVQLLEVRDDTAFIAMGGGCQGCGMASVTLKQGVEVAILDNVPAITQVLDTTDHASGDNPYFQPSKGGDSPF